MDDMMPRMRGTEALIRLKKIEGFSIPTVVLTANAISGTREGYIKDGFDDYLAKPIEKEELIKILLKYLKGNKAELSSQDNYEDYKGKKILIVDDNKLNIKVATNLLKPYNLDIEDVVCGKECIEKILSGSKYDLIFMDDMMPITTGTETMHKLKNMNIKEPIVALTANAVEGARENYLKEGFDEYISKPIDREKLREILRKFLVKN
jgi:CheY-like chemotaxis protein